MSQKNTADKKAKSAKIVAIIVFILIILSLLSAIISDFAIFSQQLLGFVVACLGSAVVLFMGFVLLVISCIFVFGIYLLNEHGFWPLTWSNNVFHEVLADYSITQEQITALKAIRIVLLIVCIIVFILSIVALAISKSAKKSGYAQKQGLTKAFSIISLILSIFGVFAAITVILVTSSL